MDHQAFGTHMVYRETFLQMQPRLLQHLIRRELNPWSSHMSEPIHSPPAGKNKNQTPVQDQRCQSGPSAKNSVIPSEGGFSNNYGADQQRLQISDPHFDKFPAPATFACWKKRFKTEVLYLFRIMPTYLLLLFEMMMFRNSIRNEMEFDYQ